jgi:Subtilase family
LREIKPEVVEEGGNYYLEGGTRLRRNPQLTDVAAANSQFARDGRLVKFTNGTSVAAPKVAHLAGLIEREIPNASVDLIRALIVNSARWPDQLANTEDTLRILGYCVPEPDRALRPGGSRCLITIEERIPIGTAHYFRIPFPAELFDRFDATLGSAPFPAHHLLLHQPQQEHLEGGPLFGALFSQLRILPHHGRQSQLLQIVLQQHLGRVHHWAPSISST